MTSRGRTRGVVAAGDSQTARAGAQLFEVGGNAVDAIVAAAFAAFVCELPLCSPLGGAVMLVEELESVMAGLDLPSRQAFEMRLQGMPVEHIARECDCSERTVRRLLERARKVIESRLLESSS